MTDRTKGAAVAPTSGLRERQKQERRLRIIEAAKRLFAESGLENITIEAIAEIAGVSSVTVYNYYGTKSGVLLALVAENDRALLASFEQKRLGQADSLIDLVLRFARIICDHAVTNLDKAIWRQVIAASVSDSDPRFGKLYRELDDRLSQVLVQEIEALQARNKVSKGVSASHLGKALFNLQNMRFIQFISSDATSTSEICDLLSDDLAAIYCVAD